MLLRSVKPMLAQRSEPFDSECHLFEVKWDGIRALVFVEAGSYWIQNRWGIDITNRFPELAFFRRLPTGTIIDGEIIVYQDGKPDFDLLLKRNQARTSKTIQAFSNHIPACYIAFDLLFGQYDSLMKLPLINRRERLEDIVLPRQNNRFVFSEGIVGSGEAFFKSVCEHDLEGVMAKTLSSPYVPGNRSGAWKKIKHTLRVLCVIIGYVPEGTHSFHNLVLASDIEGKLEYVGQVGTGFSTDSYTRIYSLLQDRHRTHPIIACRYEAVWVEPSLYCIVRFNQWTKSGMLRMPVFERLIEKDSEMNTPHKVNTQKGYLVCRNC